MENKANPVSRYPRPDSSRTDAEGNDAYAATCWIRITLYRIGVYAESPFSKTPHIPNTILTFSTVPPACPQPPASLNGARRRSTHASGQTHTSCLVMLILQICPGVAWNVALAALGPHDLGRSGHKHRAPPRCPPACLQRHTPQHSSTTYFVGGGHDASAARAARRARWCTTSEGSSKDESMDVRDSDIYK